MDITIGSFLNSIFSMLNRFLTCFKSDICPVSISLILKATWSVLVVSVISLITDKRQYNIGTNSLKDIDIYHIWNNEGKNYIPKKYLSHFIFWCKAKQLRKVSLIFIPIIIHHFLNSYRFSNLIVENLYFGDKFIYCNFFS